MKLFESLKSVSLIVVCFSVTLFVISPAYGQADVTDIEYFIDADPGFGNGTPLTVTQGSLVDLMNEILSTSALPPGTHFFGVRARNSDGVWGFTERRSFYIPSATTSDPPTADIQEMEYYVDTDPGTGNATAITVSTSNFIDIANEIISASALPVGFHTLGVRARNTDGTWGFAEKREFFIPGSTTSDPPTADIQELEYFFDVDPGAGLATPISGSGSLVDINPLIPNSLTPGHHTIHIRARNTNGEWGITESRTIYIKGSSPPVETTYDISKIEYYIDGADPGFGNATDLPIVQGPLIDLDPVLIPTSPTLIDGQHTITFRAQNTNGSWGLPETRTFDVLDDCTQPTAGFTVNLVCAGEVADIIDNSMDIDGATATYSWYVNGAPISSTVGNIQHTFANPGDYTVSLAIRQGTICYDSLGVDINIKPKPIVTFSAEKVELGSPTVFDIDAFNVDPAATWEWDFENDGTIDSNADTNVSFTYPDVGVYTVALRVSDMLGCETTYQKDVTVEAVSSGGAPTVVLSANDVELGNPTTFSIVFQSNIDPTWTWSWDFETDGTPDDTTVGETTHTYSQTGTFTATLTVDDGGGTTFDFTVEANVFEPVGIPPVVVFRATTVTISEETNYIVEFESNVDPDWDWSWDFDSDGVEDDNTNGNTSYTFPQDGEYVTSLTIVDFLSNEYVFTEIVRVLPEAVELEVYNIVTFNGDGINDFLEIENIEVVPSNKVQIFDRAGTLVFEMNEYDNRDRVFRGMSNINGTRELPQGNYFYSIDKGDGSKVLTGFIYLKR